MTPMKFRPLTFGVTRVTLRDGAPGVHYLQADQALEPYPERMTDRLRHWAQTVPERSFVARRVKLADGSLGDWRHVSYAQTWQTARNIAQGLIERGLSARAPGGHPERKQHRACAAVARLPDRRRALRADLARLFADQHRLRKTQACHHAP